MGKMNIPMHCLGFSLNPFLYDTNYLNSYALNCEREVVHRILKAFDKVGEEEKEQRVLCQQF